MTRRTLVRNVSDRHGPLAVYRSSGPRSRRGKEDQVLHCRSRTYLPRPFHAGLQDIAKGGGRGPGKRTSREGGKVCRRINVPAKNIYSYSNYDDIAANKDIDAVYIALPNSTHAEYTIRAANADKRVLCEKPMATSLRDIQSMINACRAAANRKLIIAYRRQYEPTNLRAIEPDSRWETRHHSGNRERERFC